MKSAIINLTVLASFWVAACGNGDGGREHSTSGSSWTLLVYMVADNNLEPFGLNDLNEMMQVGSGDSFNIVVQADRAAGYTSEGVGPLSDWESAKRLVVNAGTLEEVADLGEPNMGDPGTLAEFIRWGVENYPADRTGLIFWNHGGGWPGFGGDESTADHDLLTLTELKQGIGIGMGSAGLDQFDLIGFDACLMATYETARMLEPYAEYLLASEETEPGHGWDYRSLQIVKSDPSKPPDTLARELINGFEQQALQEDTHMNITLSLVDLYALNDLEDAVDSMAEKLQGDLDEKAATVGQQRATVLEFAKASDPFQSTHMVDLGDLARRLGEADGGLSGIRSDVEAALQKAVIHSVTGQATSRATGLSIYFPAHQAYYDSAYDGVEEAESWREFLKDFYQEGGQISEGPVFTNPDHVAEVGVDGDYIVVQGQLDAGSVPNVAEASLFYAVLTPDQQQIILLGDWPAELEASGLVTGLWDATATIVSQGANQAYAYLGVTYQEGYIVATVPFGYESPGSQELDYVVLTYIIDPETGQELQTTFYLFTEAGPGELFPEDGSLIYPLLMVVDIDMGDAQWMVTTDTGLDPAGSIELGFEALDAGEQVYLEIDAWDFAGNSDYVYYLGVL